MPQNKIQLPNGYLQFKPNKNLSNYGFIISFPSQGLKISYELSITLQHFINQNLAVFEINRKDFYINNKAPEVMLYQIANDMAASIYPVTFTVNQALQIIALNNHKEIITRCKETQQKIENYYKGDIPQKMIANYTKHYNDEAILVQQLQNDWWYRILFPSLYQSYSLDLKANKKCTFVFEDKKIEWDIQHQIAHSYSDTGKLIVNLKSKEKENDPSKYEATYYLYPEKNTIASAKGTIVYANDEKLETILFECYHLGSD
jgi:hypothetical protein